MKKLKRPIEEVRAELLADPATQGIAQKLGMPLEEYVEKVLDFAQHPEKKPEFNVVPDGVAKAQGGATTAEVKQWLEDVADGKVDIRPAREKDSFEETLPTQRRKK
ncbi:MAG TPA: hypothetical protein VGK67_30460 [Myxococcales bacterium]|jgi:hypothetical protein